MQAASVMQLNTGLDRRCLVTLGMTVGGQKHREKNVTQRQQEFMNAGTSLDSGPTSQVLTHRQSAVDVKAVDGRLGFGSLVLHAEGGGQHGLLALCSNVHVLLIQRLGEAKHEEGRQEE